MYAGKRMNSDRETQPMRITRRRKFPRDFFRSRATRDPVVIVVGVCNG